MKTIKGFIEKNEPALFEQLVEQAINAIELCADQPIKQRIAEDARDEGFKLTGGQVWAVQAEVWRRWNGARKAAGVKTKHMATPPWHFQGRDL